MWGKWVRADRTMVAVVERATHRFQRLTGRTNYWLVHHLTLCNAVLAAVLAVVGFRYDDTLLVMIGLPWTSLFLVLGILQGLTDYVDRKDSQAHDRLMCGLANPEKIDAEKIWLRFENLALTLVIASFLPLAMQLSHIWHARLVMIILLGLAIGTTLRLYLTACDPLPPTPGRAREWLSRLSFASMKPAQTVIK